jgi:hypothetical protein
MIRMMLNRTIMAYAFDSSITESLPGMELVSTTTVHRHGPASTNLVIFTKVS